MGNRSSSAQQVKYVGNTDVLCFGFYFMSLKLTKTKIVIETTPLLQAYSCLLLVQVAYRFLGIGPEFLIVMFLFAYLSFNVKRLILVEVVQLT